MKNYTAGIFAVPKYKSRDIQNLPFCSNDCVELEKVLTNNLGIPNENIKILGKNTDEEVNRTDILKKINSLCKNANPDDIVILYFSGHGHSENNEAFLIPYDSDLDLIPDTSIPISRVKTELKKCTAKIKVLIIDSCYSGIGYGKNVDPKMSEDFEKSLFSDITEGVVILASCKRKEQSYSLEDNSMSVFTYYLAEGLKGNANINEQSEISINDLYTYVLNKVSKWGFKNDRAQTPNMELEYAGEILFPIKNPEIPKEDSKSPNVSEVDTNIIRIELNSTYVAPSSEMICEDFPPVPTGEFRELSSGERETRTRDNRKTFTGNFLASLTRYYKPSDVKVIENNGYELPFGKFANLSQSKFENEFKLAISEGLDTEKVNELLHFLDEQNNFKWNSVEYTFNGNFDLDVVCEIAKQKNYSIFFFEKEIDISEIYFSQIVEEKSSILKRNRVISISNVPNFAKIKLFGDDKLPSEFFQTLPIEELIDTFSKALVSK